MNCEYCTNFVDHKEKSRIRRRRHTLDKETISDPGKEVYESADIRKVLMLPCISWVKTKWIHQQACCFWRNFCPFGYIKRQKAITASSIMAVAQGIIWKISIRRHIGLHEGISCRTRGTTTWSGVKTFQPKTNFVFAHSESQEKWFPKAFSALANVWPLSFRRRTFGTDMPSWSRLGIWTFIPPPNPLKKC